MKIRSFAAICFAMLLFFVLASCDSEEVEFNSGILANEEVVSSIRQELEDKENSLLASEGDVFWTPSGTLWHSAYTCSYLSSSKTVYHGTLEEARLEGKTRACERCGASNGSTDSIYEQIENNEISSGDVFFTREESLWHTTDQCEELLNEEKIYHANRALAMALGKTESCEKCGREK